MNIAIVSTNFSIGHLSHLVALFKAIKKIGHEPKFIIHDEYYKYIDKKNFLNIDLDIFLKKNYKYKKFKLNKVIIQNPGKDNYKFIKNVKRMDINTKIYYILHEPWTGFKNRLKSKNLYYVIKSFLYHIVDRLTIRASHKIVLPSDYAIKNYKKFNIKVNKNYIKMNLLFDPEETKAINEKEYFSYIGTIVPDHDFTNYLKIIKEMYILNKSSDLKFMIATKSKFSIDNLLREMIVNKRLLIQMGRPLTNDQINMYYSKSIINWLAYKRSTQSGVLAKSYMFNCYVLCSELKSFDEFIKPNLGYYLNNFQDVTELYKKIMELKHKIKHKDNQDRYDFFNSHFNYKNQLKKISKVFDIK